MANKKEKQEKKLGPEEEAKVRESLAKEAEENLEDVTLSSLAAAGFATPEQYGKLGTEVYRLATNQTPTQRAYDILYKPSLQTEGESLSGLKLKKGAQNIMIESIRALKVENLLKRMGYEGKVLEKYVGRYVNGLSDEDANEILGAYVTTLTDSYVGKALAQRQINVIGGLENKFGEPKKEKE